MSNNKTFKVSQLPQISNIDNNDLLLVSDYDSGKCITKKMTMKQVSTFVSNAMKPTIVQVVNQAVQAALSGDVQQMIVDAVDAAMSGPEFEQNIVETLDKISDGRKDNIILVDGNSINEN